MSTMIAVKPLRSNTAVVSKTPVVNVRWGNRGATILRSPISSSLFVTTILSKASMPDAPVRDTNISTNFNLKFENYYRVMLYYTNWAESDTKKITQRVKVGVPILTLKECEKTVKHAFSYGMSIVCTVPKEKAILYCETLMRLGLNATIEEA